MRTNGPIGERVLVTAAPIAIAASSIGQPLERSAPVAAPQQNPILCKGTVCRPVGVGPRLPAPSSADSTALVRCPHSYVVDGDTLRCGPERLRLLGIDAPELTSCPRWRVCASGDGQAAKSSLIAAMRFGPIRYQPITRDRFGRQVAVVWAGQVNLSCWQLQAGQAIYKPRCNNRQIIEHDCR